MGNLLSNDSNKKENYWDVNAIVFEELALQRKEINRLHKIFTLSAVRDNDYLSTDEFFAYFKLEPGDTLNQKLALSLDVRGDGKMDFCQFVCLLWNFLTLPSSQLGVYAHFLIDERKSGGALHPRQVQELIELLFQTKCEENSQLQKIYDKFRAEKFKCTAEKFRDWSLENKAVLSYIIGLHSRLRSVIVGNYFWDRLSKRRSSNLEICHPLFIYKLLKNKWLDSIEEGDVDKVESTEDIANPEVLQTIDTASEVEGDNEIQPKRGRVVLPAIESSPEHHLSDFSDNEKGFELKKLKKKKKKKKKKEESMKVAVENSDKSEHDNIKAPKKKKLKRRESDEVKKKSAVVSVTIGRRYSRKLIYSMSEAEKKYFEEKKIQSIEQNT